MIYQICQICEELACSLIEVRRPTEECMHLTWSWRRRERKERLISPAWQNATLEEQEQLMSRRKKDLVWHGGVWKQEEVRSYAFLYIYVYGVPLYLRGDSGDWGWLHDEIMKSALTFGAILGPCHHINFNVSILRIVLCRVGLSRRTSILMNQQRGDQKTLLVELSWDVMCETLCALRRSRVPRRSRYKDVF